MKMLAVVLDSQVLNIGEWDYVRMAPVDESGAAIEGAEALITNPVPEGAVFAEFDIVESADGRMVLASNHAVLRAAEYPPIGDQLDALFKAGLFPDEMAARLAAVKEKYPKLD